MNGSPKVSLSPSQQSRYNATNELIETHNKRKTSIEQNSLWSMGRDNSSKTMNSEISNDLSMLTINSFATLKTENLSEISLSTMHKNLVKSGNISGSPSNASLSSSSNLRNLQNLASSLPQSNSFHSPSNLDISTGGRRNATNSLYSNRELNLSGSNLVDLSPPLPLMKFKTQSQKAIPLAKTINNEYIMSIDNIIPNNKSYEGRKDPLGDPLHSRKLSKYFTLRAQKESILKQNDNYNTTNHINNNTTSNNLANNNGGNLTGILSQSASTDPQDSDSLPLVRPELFDYTVYESLLHTESLQERNVRNAELMSEEQCHKLRYEQYLVANNIAIPGSTQHTGSNGGITGGRINHGMTTSASNASLSSIAINTATAITASSLNTTGSASATTIAIPTMIDNSDTTEHNGTLLTGCDNNITLPPLSARSVNSNSQSTQNIFSQYNTLQQSTTQQPTQQTIHQSGHQTSRHNNSVPAAPTPPSVPSYSKSLEFSGEFESGNIEKVTRVFGRETLLSRAQLQECDVVMPSEVSQEYDITLRKDLSTEGNIQWYYFNCTALPDLFSTVHNNSSIELSGKNHNNINSSSCIGSSSNSGSSGSNNITTITNSNTTKYPLKVRFNIINFQKNDSLYNYGMKPCVYSCNQIYSEDWTHSGCDDICYYRNGISTVKLSNNSGTTSNNDNNNSGNSIPRNKNKNVISYQYTLTFTYTFTSPDSVYFAHTFPYTYTHLQEYLASLELDTRIATFMHRKVLCKTLAGNNCDLISLTERCNGVIESKIKPSIIITARVHPGEANSSYMMHGLMDFLTSDSPEALKLRKSFVFHLVPMLNPDGVIHGNYRCSLAGTDLNRRYLDTNSTLHPTVAALKQFIRTTQQHRHIMLYLDLHGHSKNKNCFMYGCDLTMQPDKVKQQLLPALTEEDLQSRRIFARLFPKILCTVSKSLGNSNFSYRDCAFAMDRSKQGTGRIVMYKQSKIAAAYTIEASFCGNGNNQESKILKRSFNTNNNGGGNETSSNNNGDNNNASASAGLNNNSNINSNTTSSGSGRKRKESVIASAIKLSKSEPALLPNNNNNSYNIGNNISNSSSRQQANATVNVNKSTSTDSGDLSNISSINNSSNINGTGGNSGSSGYGNQPPLSSAQQAQQEKARQVQLEQLNDLIASYNTATHYNKHNLISIGYEIGIAIYHFTNLTHSNLDTELSIATTNEINERAVEIEKQNAFNKLQNETKFIRSPIRKKRLENVMKDMSAVESGGNEKDSGSYTIMGDTVSVHNNTVANTSANSKQNSNSHSNNNSGSNSGSNSQKGSSKNITFNASSKNLTIDSTNEAAIGSPTGTTPHKLTTKSNSNSNNLLSTSFSTSATKRHIVIANTESAESGTARCESNDSDGEDNNSIENNTTAAGLAAGSATATRIKNTEFEEEYGASRVDTLEESMLHRSILKPSIFSLSALSSLLNKHTKEFSVTENATLNIGLRIKCEYEIRRQLQYTSDQFTTLNMNINSVAEGVDLSALGAGRAAPAAEEEGSVEGSESDPSGDNVAASKLLKNMGKYKDTNSLVHALRKEALKQRKKEAEEKRKSEKKKQKALAKLEKESKRIQDEINAAAAAEAAIQAQKLAEQLAWEEAQKRIAKRRPSSANNIKRKTSIFHSSPKHTPNYRYERTDDKVETAPVQIKLVSFRDFDRGQTPHYHTTPAAPHNLLTHLTPASLYVALNSDIAHKHNEMNNSNNSGRPKTSARRDSNNSQTIPLHTSFIGEDGVLISSDPNFGIGNQSGSGGGKNVIGGSSRRVNGSSSNSALNTPVSTERKTSISNAGNGNSTNNSHSSRNRANSNSSSSSNNDSTSAHASALADAFANVKSSNNIPVVSKRLSIRTLNDSTDISTAATANNKPIVNVSPLNASYNIIPTNNTSNESSTTNGVTSPKRKGSFVRGSESQTISSSGGDKTAKPKEAVVANNSSSGIADVNYFDSAENSPKSSTNNVSSYNGFLIPSTTVVYSSNNNSNSNSNSNNSNYKGLGNSSHNSSSKSLLYSLPTLDGTAQETTSNSHFNVNNTFNSSSSSNIRNNYNINTTSYNSFGGLSGLNGMVGLGSGVNINAGRRPSSASATARRK